MGLAIGLLIAGFILVILELFLPSAGILALLAAAVLISANILAYNEHYLSVFLAIEIIIIPILIFLGLKFVTRTPIGKKMTLKPEVESEVNRGRAIVSDENFYQLLGLRGKTLTPLRPSGIAEINGQRYSVVARGQIIDSGKAVEVTEVEGNSIIVEELI